MNTFAIIILIIVILSLVNNAYKISGYPTLLQLTKEKFVIHFIKFEYKGYKPIVFYSYDSNTYFLRVHLDNKNEFIYENHKSLKKLRDIFHESLNDYLELGKFNE